MWRCDKTQWRWGNLGLQSLGFNSWWNISGWKRIGAGRRKVKKSTNTTGHVNVQKNIPTSDFNGEDRRAMRSNSIPGLTVILTAFTRANFREGEDRTRLGTPCCMTESKKGEDILNHYTTRQKDKPHKCHVASLTTNNPHTASYWKYCWFCNVNLEWNHIFMMLTLYRAPVQS